MSIELGGHVIAPNWTKDEHQKNSLDSLLERHDREHFQFKQMNEPEQQRFQLQMREAYARNPWLFLKNCVYTLDQVDKLKPKKPFPSYLEYLEFLTHLWLTEQRLAIPKSRRMTCSWNFIALYTQDTIFNGGRFNGFVSKKEDDAGDLISRAEFIYQNIPEWRIPKALLPKIKNGKMSKSPPVIEFEDINSKLQGFPQGADQLRQFTLSGILGDECAFWEQARKFYSSSTPTLEGGGRMTLISSRSPGFFKNIVFDQMDAETQSFPEKPAGPLQRPMEGVDVWKNPSNGFIVVDLHYTANPAKRGKAWREATRAAMPKKDFEMEYEKSWQTFEGKPVYEDFVKTVHVAQGLIEPAPGIPLLLGFDFGLTPACIVGQLVGRQLRLLHEFIEKDGSISKLAPEVWEFLRVNFFSWTANADEKIFTWIDPAGFQRSQVDEKTCAGVLRETGFKRLYPGPVDWEARRQAVEKFLIKMHKGEPGMIVSEAGCPIIIEGFAGGYKYPPKALEIEPNSIRPLKDAWSHPHDALQYLCHGATGKAKQSGIDLFPPNYGFQKQN